MAQWEPVPQPGRGGGPPQIPRFGNLKVTTTNLTAGWLRKNGVPYSENATVTEYFDRFKAPNNDEWLVVTTIVVGPEVPEPGLRHQQPLQEGAERRQVEPVAV